MIEVEISKLDETDMFYLWFKKGDDLVEGKLERSEIREIIGKLDNII